MAKKFSKAHRAKLSAAATARYANKDKKRGVKPGTKRGKYRTAKQIINKALRDAGNQNQVGHDPKLLRITWPEDYVKSDGHAVETFTPYEQLDKVLNDLELRILNTVARIKSLGI